MSELQEMFMNKKKLEEKKKKLLKEVTSIDAEVKALNEENEAKMNKASNVKKDIEKVEAEIMQQDDEELFISRGDLRKFIKDFQGELMETVIELCEFSHISKIKNEKSDWASKIVKSPLKENMESDYLEMYAEEVDGTKPFYLIFVNGDRVKEIKLGDESEMKIKPAKKSFIGRIKDKKDMPRVIV